MLNTQSRLGAALIWLVIVAIVVRAAWTLFALGHPLDIVRAIADSPLSAFLARNQIAVTGLLGFGALAFAHVFNGWRDRAERRHVIERGHRRLAAVLSRDAAALAAEFESAATTGTSPLAGTLHHPTDSLLLSAPMAEMARLGPGVATAVQVLRACLRGLTPEVRNDKGDRPGVPLLQATFAARNVQRVLETLIVHGDAAADSLRLLPPSDDDIARLIPALADQPHATRLLPAA